MKLKLKPLQARILVKLGTAREMPFDQLAKALMPARDAEYVSGQSLHKQPAIDVGKIR